MKLLIIFLCSKQNLMNILSLLSLLVLSSLIFIFKCSSIASIKLLVFSLDTIMLSISSFISSTLYIKTSVRYAYLYCYIAYLR